MSHVIVTGQDNIDIDMLACVQALYEALTLQGKEVYVHGSPTYTASITEEVKKYISTFPEKEILEENDKLYAVDVSSVDYLQKRCGYPVDQFVAIWDHHFDNVDFWKEKIGEAAVIEEMGAAATLVARFAKESELFDLLTDDTKILIAAAIVSNSQNFKLSMTQVLDHDIYNEIAGELNFTKSWPEEYLLSVQDEIGNDVSSALKSDMKESVLLNEKTFGIAQMEMWDTSIFLKNHMGKVAEFVNHNNSEISFFISASLSEDLTYFVATDEESKLFLTNLLSVVFDGDVAVLDEIMIRKQIVKMVLEQ